MTDTTHCPRGRKADPSRRPRPPRLAKSTRPAHARRTRPRWGEEMRARAPSLLCIAGVFFLGEVWIGRRGGWAITPWTLVNQSVASEQEIKCVDYRSTVRERGEGVGGGVDRERNGESWIMREG